MEIVNWEFAYVFFAGNSALPAHKINLAFLLLRAGVEADGMIQAPLPALFHEPVSCDAAHCGGAFTGGG